jgi:hypothetical protein
MPKATWGSGDKALSAADIDGAEREAPRTRYSGPQPRSGTYRFVIKSMKQGVSSNNNPMITITSILDGSWMPNHKEYDGFPLWDRLPVMDSTKGRVANFLDAIGATGEDLMRKTIVDENGYITKLGDVGDPAGIMCYITIKRDKPTKQYPEPGMSVDFNGYIPLEDDADADGAAGTADGEDEPPF